MKKVMSVIMVLILLLTLTACDSKWVDRKSGKSSMGTQRQEEADLTYLDPSRSTNERVDSLLSQMSLMEKAGQMLQAERNRVTPEEMTSLGLGSVLSGGGSYPGSNTLADWNEMFLELQKGALETTYKIPMLYGVDAVHGLGLLKGAVVFPHNIGLGAANDPELMYQMGAAVAQEMKLVNILWNFGPCVAVSTDPRWGRTYESYSSDPAIVAALAEAYLKGQQDQGIASTAKHYLADGGTVYGTGEINALSDRGDSRMAEEELRSIHLAPYQTLVDSGRWYGKDLRS
jgi:beta-glucosidase